MGLIQYVQEYSNDVRTRLKTIEGLMRELVSTTKEVYKLKEKQMSDIESMKPEPRKERKLESWYGEGK